MRLKTKYKQISKFTKLFETCTISNINKILKFKRSKWKKDFKLISLKSLNYSIKILKNYRINEKSRYLKFVAQQRNYFFKNIKRNSKHFLLNIKKNTKKPLNLTLLLFKFSPLTPQLLTNSFYFNAKLNSLVSKKLIRYSIFRKEFPVLLKSLNFLYDNNITTTFFNNQIYKYKKQSFINFFILPFYNLSILLWKLGLFPSTYLADQYIYQNKILINSKIVNSSYFLKTGDIISFHQNIFKEYKLYKHLEINSRYILLNSIIEIDLYTSSIIIIKGVELLHDYDLQLLSYENINFNNFLNYIKY